MNDKPDADFSYRFLPGVIAIFDHERGGRSVTNDADAIIAEMTREGISFAGRRVIYRDTMGTWDELIVRDGRFVGFGSLDALTLDLALRKIARTPVPKPI